MSKNGFYEKITKDYIKNEKEELTSVFFDPSNPKHVHAWSDLYVLYMSSIKENDRDFFVELKGIERLLYSVFGSKTLLFLFMKVVPIVEKDDREPFEFLKDALEELKNGGIDKLCLFIQLATSKVEKIKKEFEDYFKTNNARLANVISVHSINKAKREEGKILEPRFREYMESEDCFSVSYRVFIDDLVKSNKKYLCDQFKSCNDIDTIRLSKLFVDLETIQEKKEAASETEKKDLLEKKETELYESIVKEVLKSNSLYDSFRKKYERMRYRIENLDYLYLPHINLALFYSLVEKVFWKSQGRWPIKKALTEYETIEPPIIMSDAEVILGLPTDIVLTIILLCEETPRNIEEINAYLNENRSVTINKAQLFHLAALGLLDLTISDQPESPDQKYLLGQKAIEFLNKHKD